MKTVSISEFKARCLALIESVRVRGVPLTVTRRGVPVARVLPPPRGDGSWLGRHRDDCSIVGDIVAPVLDSRDWDALAK
jgi:prevent-host-death family protein